LPRPDCKSARESAMNVAILVSRSKAMPDGALTSAIRHSSSFDVRSCVRGLCRPFSRPLVLSWHCQIRCSHVACIDSSAGYLALVIYVFGTFESRRIVAFRVVEIPRYI